MYLRPVLQVVAMFVSLNFDWPQELQSLFAAMSVFNFNIQITAPEVRVRNCDRPPCALWSSDGCKALVLRRSHSLLSPLSLLSLLSCLWFSMWSLRPQFA